MSALFGFASHFPLLQQLESSSHVPHVHNNKLHVHNRISQFSFQFTVTRVEPINIPKFTKALQDTQTPMTTKGL